MTRHITCAEAASRLYPFLDGELTWIRRAKIRWHLRACTKCEAAFLFEQHFKAKVAESLVEDCPDEVVERLRYFLHENE